MIEFDDALLTHVDEMDNQHRRLVDLLNDVYTLLKESKREEAIKFWDISQRDLQPSYIGRARRSTSI